MMKAKTKRMIMALVMSVMMIMGLAATAMAGEPAAAQTTATITLENGKATSEYSVYQVMTATLGGQDAEGNNLYTYEVTDAFKAFFANGANGFTLDGNNVIYKDGTVVVSDGFQGRAASNTTVAATLAAALSRYAIANGIATAAVIRGTAASDALPVGYYVVAETKSGEASEGTDEGAEEVATKPILVNLTENKAITLKDDTTTLDKDIVENGSTTKSNNVNIGDDVEYQITTKIPTYEANVDKTKLMFKLTDAFSAGLDYNYDIDIDGFTIDADYTAAYDESTRELVITFTQDAIYNNQGAQVVAHYTAKLNADAEVDSTTGNPNTVKLEYTNNTNEEESHKTLEDKTITYTYGFNVHKVDKVAPTESLGNAKFQLKDEEGNVITFTKDGNVYVVDPNGTETEIVSVGYTESDGKKVPGLAVVKGLEEGTYTLIETQAPDGYTKLDDKGVSVEIVAVRDATTGKETGEATLKVSGAGNAGAEVKDDWGNKTGEVTSSGDSINIDVYVENAKGISLPETGRNEALYMMIGGAVVVIAGILFFALSSRKKKARR